MAAQGLYMLNWNSASFWSYEVDGKEAEFFLIIILRHINFALFISRLVTHKEI